VNDEKIRELKLPSHSEHSAPIEISMLPIKWAPYVGFIRALWGDFETRVDELTEILSTINKTTLPGDGMYKILESAESSFWTK
jgi:hypothetical protein